MATVRTNDLINGLSGTLGSIVFKNYKGNTIVTSKPRLPQTQSAQQKDNRSKFKRATAWAKAILLDPVKKEYYQKKAKKLKLLNAYTAAITDYMRKPKLISFSNHDNTITCSVSKKDFQVKKVEVIVTKAEGDEVRTIAAQGTECFFKLTREEVDNAWVSVMDDVGNEYLMEVMRVFNF